MRDPVAPLGNARFDGFCQIREIGPLGMISLRAKADVKSLAKAIKAAVGTKVPAARRIEMAGGAGNHLGEHGLSCCIDPLRKDGLRIEPHSLWDDTAEAGIAALEIIGDFDDILLRSNRADGFANCHNRGRSKVNVI